MDKDKDNLEPPRTPRTHGLDLAMLLAAAGTGGNAISFSEVAAKKGKRDGTLHQKNKQGQYVSDKVRPNEPCPCVEVGVPRAEELPPHKAKKHDKLYEPILRDLREKQAQKDALAKAYPPQERLPLRPVVDAVYQRRDDVLVGEPTPLTWSHGVSAFSHREPVVNVRCDNGHIGMLAPGHTVDANGKVTPSVCCPIDDCGWHAWATLADWTPPAAGGP